MSQTTLSNDALTIIENYLHLPLGLEFSIPCPYFNNRRAGVRAGLRVVVGKGSYDDIVKEVELLALKKKIDLSLINKTKLRELLVDNNIGIDCSALAYYILDAELKSKGKKSLRKTLAFPYAKNPIRKLLAKIRPVENINVKTLAHDSNSKEVELSQIKPGDLIILLNAGSTDDLNHVLVVHAVDHEDRVLTAIHYTHSFQWATDGKYNHGVRQGTIEVEDITKPILKQKWIEKEKVADDNETFQHALKAASVTIRRLV